VAREPMLPNRTPPPVEDDWGRPSYYWQEPEAPKSTPYLVASLVVLALAVFCVLAFLIVRILPREQLVGVVPTLGTWTSSPTAAASAQQSTVPPASTSAQGETTIAIQPDSGYINTLVSVSGEGWWPGEPVFVFLRSPEEGTGRGYSYAAAVADDSGRFRTALTFPNEVRWMSQVWADVIARGTRSGLEVMVRFTLMPPTPTHTLPPPTARPTSAATNTPPPTKTPSSPPTATPTPVPVITDWKGEYFANKSLSGEPVWVRNDVSIDFEWGEGSPGGGVPSDEFSVRWSRVLLFRKGWYLFTAVADDGARLWVDGQLLIDEWHDGPATAYTSEFYLPRGDHILLLEYYENIGHAEAAFSVARIDAPPTETPTPPEFTATPSPTPTDVPPVTGGWKGKYFDNTDLQGGPVLVRDDEALHFDWGEGSPGPSVPADYFSARWTKSVWLDAGVHSFSLMVDDGARLWVDGILLIDEWHQVTGKTYVGEIFLEEGVHRLQVEYYEDAFSAHIHLWED
jgi:hypothetical protein